jgi:hypothetical protein
MHSVRFLTVVDHSSLNEIFCFGVLKTSTVQKLPVCNDRYAGTNIALLNHTIIN